VYKRSRGFSLVELLAVLAIISIIAAIATRNFASVMSNARMKTTVAELTADIRYAQQIAIGQRTNCYVVFDNYNKFYSIQVNDYLAPKIIKRVYFDKKLDIDSNYEDNDNRFCFTDIGAPSPKGGTINISGYGRIYEITILPATGRVKVKSAY